MSVSAAEECSGRKFIFCLSRENGQQRMPAEHRGGNTVNDTEHKKETAEGKGTFLVRIKFQQHSSWQGEVFWAEKKRKSCFRSELELIRLIDSALKEGNEGEEQNGKPE